MPDDRIGKTCLVSSAVTNFEHQGIACNLRALTAVDSASIVLDAAKGLESSLAGSSRSAGCATCRSTFVTKLGRDGCDPANQYRVYYDYLIRIRPGHRADPLQRFSTTQSGGPET